MKQQIALITGGSRGLGKNTALHLAQKGVDVILTFNSQQVEAAAVVAQIEKMGRRAVAIQLNLANSATFGAFVEQVQQQLKQIWQREHLDFLVNNAGHGVHKPFIETSEADFDLLMQVHVKGVFFLTQKLLPLMHQGGRIINLSSGLARFSLPGFSAYATMKGAIEVLTRYLAKELGPQGISVNTVAPGAIETDFGGGAVRDDHQLNEFVASQTALGRAGQPDDIGAVIAALLTEPMHWINGQRIEASGGMFL